MNAVSSSIALPEDGALDWIEHAADRLELLHPTAALEWAAAEFGDRVALATGFGVEGAALIEMAARARVEIRMFFLDTGFLFPETYELRRRIEEKYGVRIRAYGPKLSPDGQARQFGKELWKADPDTCCRLRKLDPLEEALGGLDAWITAIRRDQSPARAGARVVEWDHRWSLVKVNPLARWSRDQVWDHVRRNRVPYNPLHDLGYPSLGCVQCTRQVRAGEDERAGRWPGHSKTECGLHASISGARVRTAAGSSGTNDGEYAGD